MAIKDLKKWLDTPCPANEVRYLDEENKKGQYIPIGIIEQNLDEFESWDTENWKYAMQRVDKNWVASGSIELTVYHNGEPITKVGATTFPVGSKLTNDDFEGTALSLAIANASKKLGKRFGRHLNGRLEIGEKTPVIDLDAARKLDAAIDEINGAKTEIEIKELYENKYPEYQKNREFVVAVSNMKHILKIKSTGNGTGK